MITSFYKQHILLIVTINQRIIGKLFEIITKHSVHVPYNFQKKNAYILRLHQASWFECVL